VAYLRQVVFGQAGHFHHGAAVNAAPEHGTGNFQLAFQLAFQFAFIAAFFTTLFTQLDALLDPLLDTLLNTFCSSCCAMVMCVPVLWHTLCQFAYKGFGVGCFACLKYIVYQRYDLG
jgi:hypothetical protein